MPRPVSYAHCGNNFGPEALHALKERSYKFARRGLPPEAKYGTLEVGAAFDPALNHPLLIPSTGDAYPAWSVGQFERVLAKSKPGKAVVIQFHGVPDTLMTGYTRPRKISASTWLCSKTGNTMCWQFETSNRL